MDQAKHSRSEEKRPGNCRVAAALNSSSSPGSVRIEFQGGFIHRHGGSGFRRPCEKHPPAADPSRDVNSRHPPTATRNNEDHVTSAEQRQPGAGGGGNQEGEPGGGTRRGEPGGGTRRGEAGGGSRRGNQEGGTRRGEPGGGSRRGKQEGEAGGGTRRGEAGGGIEQEGGRPGVLPSRKGEDSAHTETRGKHGTSPEGEWKGGNRDQSSYEGAFTVMGYRPNTAIRPLPHTARYHQ